MLRSLIAISGFLVLKCLAISQSQFEAAVENGDLAAVKQAISDKSSIDISKTFANYPPIHVAAFNGHLSIVEALLDGGVDPNLKNFNNTIPLFSAVRGDQPAIIELLASRGGDLNGIDFVEGFYTPLMLAAAHANSAKSIVALHKLGLDVNVRVKAQTKLVPKDDIGGDTPLIASSFTGSLDAAKALLGLGANIFLRNRQGNDALLAASYKGHHLIVQALLEAGANASVQNSDGFNAVMFAASAKNPKLLRMLLKAGASVNVPNGIDYNPLILAVRTLDTPTLQELYNWKPDVNAYDSVNYTALYHALTNNHLKVVKELMRRGGALGHVNDHVKGIKDEWTRHVMTCDWFYGILKTNNLSTTQVSGATYPYLDYCEHIRYLKAGKCIVKLIDQANLYGYDGLVNRLNFKSFTDSMNGNFEGVKRAKERAYQDIKHLHRINYRNKYEEDVEEVNERLPKMLHRFSEDVEPPRPKEEKEFPSLSEILAGTDTVRQVHRPKAEERPPHARDGQSLKEL
jgi:ankyrin repeat protein